MRNIILHRTFLHCRRDRVGRSRDVDLSKVEARLALALGRSPEGPLIAFGSGWHRETARLTFSKWGSRLQLSINARRSTPARMRSLLASSRH